MKKLTYILVGSILTLASCTEKIDLELNEDENIRLVVDGWVTNQLQQHEVRLTTTSSYFATQEAPKADGATVTLSDGSTTWPLVEEEPGLYRTPALAGEIGKTYRLDIVWEGEGYTAASYLDTVADIDSLAYEYHVFPDEPEENHYDLIIWTQELPGVGDNYMWRVLKNGVPQASDLTDITFVEDALVDGMYIGNVQIETVDAQIGDTIRLDQFAITAEAYDIFTAVMSETAWNGGLFDAPPANVPSNVSNGALGYFGAAGVSSYEVVIQN